MRIDHGSTKSVGSVTTGLAETKNKFYPFESFWTPRHCPTGVAAAAIVTSSDNAYACGVRAGRANASQR